MSDTFTLSIEPQSGPSFQHGYHLGTDEPLARQLAVEICHRTNAKSVALLRDYTAVDYFDGTMWNSDLVNEAFDE